MDYDCHLRKVTTRSRSRLLLGRSDFVDVAETVNGIEPQPVLDL
jgi:hypothetical protein